MKQETNTEQVAERVITVGVGHDFRNAALIVSVLLNLVIFIAWLILQVTTQYDSQVASLLFTR